MATIEELKRAVLQARSVLLQAQNDLIQAQLQGQINTLNQVITAQGELF